MATLGPQTTKSKGPETEKSGSDAAAPADPMAEAVKFAAEHPKVVPPGIHVPSNQYGPKAVARKEREEGGGEEKKAPAEGEKP